MSKQQVNHLKPFFSVIIIITTLFAMLFIKMEVRRMGYTVWKQSQEHKKWEDHKRLKEIKFAYVTRPERLRQMAIRQLTLNEAQTGQIIQLSGDRVAIPQ